MKLVIIISHPIQYYAPWFRELSKYCNLHVLYLNREDNDFGRSDSFSQKINWDIDLLSGYPYSVLKNIAFTKSPSKFFGTINIGIVTSLLRLRPDNIMIIGWYNVGLIQSIFSAHILRIPIFARSDSKIEEGEKHGAFYTLLYRLFLRMYTGHFYCGTMNKEYLKGHGVSNSRLTFVPHFSSVPDMSKDDSGRGVSDKMTFLFVGKLSQKKRPLDLIDAWIISGLANKEEVELIFIGDGALFEDLDLRIRQKSLLNVRLEGFRNQTELSAIYQKAHSIVLPSGNRETWGLVINEAMQYGCAAIVSDKVGCSRDLVINDENGYIFRSGNISELSECLNKVLLLNPKEVNEANNKILRVFSQKNATTLLLNKLIRA